MDIKLDVNMLRGVGGGGIKRNYIFHLLSLREMTCSDSVVVQQVC